MSDIVIKVENLSKSYTIGHQNGERYTALRDVLSNGVKGIGNRLFGRTNGHTGVTSEEFWALSDVSFDVKQGERVGIIGRNGAGKSTLLKILSRITEPTKGRVHIKGRVASLLEVGTGFHPELTGRENIYLNGAILGMSREEIRRKFDEIVAFAEVEKFLDTPVKRYSSGMYVRLAFAVAAHLEPEILVVDEVLAVGDAAFQKKCLGKMEDVATDGRTILFVSHQMDMIRSLCNRCILFSDGAITADGPAESAIAQYSYQMMTYNKKGSFLVCSDKNLSIQIISGRIINNAKNPESVFDVRSDINIEINYIVRESVLGSILILELKKNNTIIFSSFDTDNSPDFAERKLGYYKASIKIPAPLLKPGEYSINLGVGIANVGRWQYLEDVLQFDVDFLSRPSSLLSSAGKRPGIIATFLDWKIEANDNTTQEQ